MSARPRDNSREATRGCMGRLRFGAWALVVIITSLFLFLPACGGHKPAGSSPFAVRIILNPGNSTSMQMGTTLQLSASAYNNANSVLRTAFTFAVNPSSPTGVLDVAPNGAVCAGAWNAPAYTLCTPAGTGVVSVTASALGVTSPPTLIFVHGPIDNIQISLVPPVNSPPPACPNQTVLPAACNLKFNSSNGACLSTNQTEILQATAYYQGNDITASVGPFTWSQSNNSVATLSPIVDPTYNVQTNQVTVSPGATPGQTQIIASASGASSESSTASTFEACPVQCIALELGATGSQSSTETSFVVNKGTSETITATAVDVQGCIVPKAPLTWISSSPAALAAGSATSGCPPGAPCTVITPQPGAAAISASCTPPACNVGFPLNPAGFPAGSIYIPQPVYPVTAISGLVTGATAATSVFATSQDCYSDPLCTVGFYNISTATNLSGGAITWPAAPNSLLFDPAGDRGYAGSEFGAIAVTPGNIGSTTNPFSFLAAPGTALGIVTGNILAVSHNGSSAVFSDTISTPNQVYIVKPSSSATPLNINSATAAAFSPDGLQTLIVGDGGNTLNIYSTLQALQPPISLPAPATSVAFNSSGSFALLGGGTSPGTLAVYNTCDNSSVTLTPPGPPLPAPPIFLKMVPAGNVPMGSTFGGTMLPADLETLGLDFFFGLDNTGIDVIATNSFMPPLTALCPQQVTVAQIQPLTTPATFFSPFHINIGQGTFHPINFFLSPDAAQAYIVTSDLGVLVYDFSTNSTSAIPLVNNAIPIAADITVDGTLIYVAGSDGLLHEVSIPLSLDRMQVFFSLLPDSPNSFCYTGSNCALNMVAVRP
jgi:hypothetical protein